MAIYGNNNLLGQGKFLGYNLTRSHTEVLPYGTPLALMNMKFHS